MVRLSADLLTLKDSFTTYDYFALDGDDVDVGSGGLMILPDQPGFIPHLAIAGGKDGRAFLLNRDNMGGYTQGGPEQRGADHQHGRLLVRSVVLRRIRWRNPRDYRRRQRRDQLEAADITIGAVGAGDFHRLGAR